MNTSSTPLTGLWDTHMHSQFSGDSKAAQEEMIAASIERGLSGICFTDHLDIDYPEEPDLFLLVFQIMRLPGFRLSGKVCRKASGQARHRSWLTASSCGLLTDILSQYPSTMFIGSSHVVHGMDPYYSRFYEGRAEQECYREYFESILENIAAFDGFDVYGHLDYVVRYGPTRNENYRWTDYQDVIDEILRQLIARGKGIEINTGGFKYGLGHPNPTEGIIRRYRELGGEIITLGADAHAPEHVGYDFEKVPGILKDAGFAYFTVFRRRKPEFVKIP